MPYKRQHSSGQVTIEYILLLLVIVLIVKFVASPMGKIFAQWTRFLVGPYASGQGYYGCLMEKGLLPGGPLRGESCPNIDLDFDLAAFGGTLPPGTLPPGTLPPGTLPPGTPPPGTPPPGTPPPGTPPPGTPPPGTPPPGTPPGSPNGPNGPNKSGDKSGNKSVTGNKNSKDSSSSGNQGSGQSSSEGSSSGSSNAAGGDSSGGDKEAYGLDNGAFGSAGKGKKRRKKRFRKRGSGSGDDDQQFSFQRSKSKRRGYRGRRRFRTKRSRGILGQRFLQEERQEERPPSFVLAEGSITGKTHSSGGESQGKGLKLKTGEKNSSGKVDDSMEPTDYGKFLKYLFFVAIIIAVIVLIGSQIVEFQNAD